LAHDIAPSLADTFGMVPNQPYRMNDVDMPRLRILVSYPEPLLALGLAAALGQQAHFDVLAPPTDGGPSAWARADVVVTDYQRGLSFAREALRGALRCRILVMTHYDREQDVRAAMEAGVHGYLLLGCSIEELVRGVERVGTGNRYLSLEVAQKMADSLGRESLTTRETDVLRLLAVGQCNKSIARDLEITVGTVKGHVRAIFGKLDAGSRTEAVGIAIRRGLIGEPMRSHRIPRGSRPAFARHARVAPECQ
jgi:DNA-binding NarL/FixJ family response regulator